MTAATRVAKTDRILDRLAEVDKTTRRFRGIRRGHPVHAAMAIGEAITALVEAVQEFDEHERQRVNAIVGRTGDEQDREAELRQAYLTGHARAMWEADGDRPADAVPPTLDQLIRKILMGGQS